MTAAATTKIDEVRCSKEGCGKTWPRDPVLEVTCPTCRAQPGHRCVRPSQHKVFGAKHGFFHAARDLAADEAGKYGDCPLGQCGIVNRKGKAA